MGGFRISDFHREIRTGEDVVGSIDSFAGLVREPFEADVVRLTEEGDVCCRFLVLPKAVKRPCPRSLMRARCEPSRRKPAR